MGNLSERGRSEANDAERRVGNPNFTERFMTLAAGQCIESPLELCRTLAALFADEKEL